MWVLSPNGNRLRALRMWGVTVPPERLPMKIGGGRLSAIIVLYIPKGSREQEQELTDLLPVLKGRGSHRGTGSYPVSRGSGVIGRGKRRPLGIIWQKVFKKLYASFPSRPKK